MIKPEIKEKVLISLFIVAVFISFLGPISDPDFPFHLKTGEYIVQYKSIPADDPFSFYSEGFATEREKFLMSRYWLAQILFFKLYDLFGPSGLIILRSLIFTSFVTLLWIVLKKNDLYVSLIVCIVLTIMLQASKGDRPQYFSFIFTLIMILLIERYRNNPSSFAPLFVIPPLMLLWANMHGGFIFGIAILLIYSFTEAFKYLLKKPEIFGKSLEPGPLLIFVLISLSSVILTSVKPYSSSSLFAYVESHVKLLIPFLDVTKQGLHSSTLEPLSSNMSWLYKINREYMSPLKELQYSFGIRHSVVGFFAIFCFMTILLALHIIRKRSLDLTALILFIFSSIAAFTAVRYIPFFVATTLPLIRHFRAPGTFAFSKNKGYINIMFVLFSLFFTTVIISGSSYHYKSFTSEKQSEYPQDATNFLLEQKLTGNIFNQSSTGSYLLWKLYPHNKVFIDTRFINPKAFRDAQIISYALEDYGQPLYTGLANALSILVPEEIGTIQISSDDSEESPNKNEPLWKRLLNQFNIDIIFHEATVAYSQEIYPLTLRLINDDEWVLIYLDGSVQIFIRNKEEFSDIIEKFKKPKKRIYDEIIHETTPFVLKKTPLSAPFSSLALALVMKDRHEGAQRMIDAALALNNSDLVAHFCSAYLALVQKQKRRESLNMSLVTSND